MFYTSRIRHFLLFPTDFVRWHKPSSKPVEDKNTAHSLEKRMRGILRLESTVDEGFGFLLGNEGFHALLLIGRGLYAGEELGFEQEACFKIGLL